LFAYRPADATAMPKTLSPLASFKSRLVLPFWYHLTQVVLEKRPLNGCSRSSHAEQKINWSAFGEVNDKRRVKLAVDRQ